MVRFSDDILRYVYQVRSQMYSYLFNYVCLFISKRELILFV